MNVVRCCDVVSNRPSETLGLASAWGVVGFVEVMRVLKDCLSTVSTRFKFRRDAWPRARRTQKERKGGAV